MREQLRDGPRPHVLGAQVTAERVRLVVVDYGRSATPADLVAPHDLAVVFTADERRHCVQGGRSLHHWAGRLAAKRAVLAVLDIAESGRALRAAEIVPGPHERATVEPHLCRLGHRPTVHLDARVIPTAETVELSISHTDGVAVAIAVVTPNGQRPTTTLT